MRRQSKRGEKNLTVLGLAGVVCTSGMWATGVRFVSEKAHKLDQ